jgi:phage major head subunit gpT-like protein
MVGATGFEPVTTRTPSVCATRLRYAPTAVLSCGKCNITPWLNQFKDLWELVRNRYLAAFRCVTWSIVV